MRFRVVNIVQAAAQTGVGIELLAIQWHHGKMDQLELQIAFKPSKDLILQHLDGKAWCHMEPMPEDIDGPTLI